jgi:hypothetical protein
MKGNVVRSLRREDPLERMGGFLAILCSSDERSIGEVEAAWLELKKAGLQLPAEELLLNHRLGQLRGAAAMEGRTGTAADFASLGLLKGRFEGWLSADPAGARMWMEGLPAGKFRDQMAMSVIAAATRDDPREALQQAACLPDHLRQAAGRNAGERLKESVPLEESSELLARMSAMEGGADEAYLKGIFDSLAGAAFQSGGEAMARVLDGHIEQSYASPQTLRQISEEMGKRDPLAALEWASDAERKKAGLPEGALLTASVQGMTLSDLERAEEWARDRSGLPGVPEMRETLLSRRRILEDRGDSENEYDKDD